MTLFSRVYNFELMELGRRKFLFLTTGAVAGVGVIAISRPFLGHMNPADDAPSRQYTDIDISDLKEGEQILLKINSEHIYIRHRRPSDIEAVRRAEQAHDDLQPDEERLRAFEGKKDPRFIIVNARSNRWGHIAMPASGDFSDEGGWYSQHYANHYDGSGRMRKGAGRRADLKIPIYEYISPTKIRFFKGPKPPEI